MTTWANTLKTRVPFDSEPLRQFGRRGLALTALLAATLAVPGGTQIAALALADAYLQVSVFVAATLFVLLGAQRLLRTDLGDALARRPFWQVPAGAALGALPGCGGAIVAITQFTRGTLSFGGVVATLASTMGDAMLLLLAREPTTAGLVLAVSAGAGIVTGYVVDAIHGPRFLQPSSVPPTAAHRWVWFDGKPTAGESLWLALLVPGLVLGIAGAMQVEFDPRLTASIGTGGGVLALGMWLTRGGKEPECSGACSMRSQGRKLIEDTNFVTAWVVFAFIGYELAVTASGLDLAGLFGIWAAAVPALASAIGLVPGCGPQIVTTALYLEGAIPLSAQLGNAISNDGDALFPAIAKAPKAAALATLYTTVPAILVAYGAYAAGW